MGLFLPKRLPSGIGPGPLPKFPIFSPFFLADGSCEGMLFHEMKTKSRLPFFLVGCVVGIILTVVGLVLIPNMAATPLTVSQHSQGNFVVAAYRDGGPVQILVADDQSFVLPEGCVYVGVSPDGSVIIEEDGQIYRLSAISNNAVREALQAEPEGTISLMNARPHRE